MARRHLLLFRRAVAPEREIVQPAHRSREPAHGPESVVYVRDVYDHLVRITDELDTHREPLSGALEAYLSTVNNNLSEIMKRLTAVTAGVGAVAGIFGKSEAASALDLCEGGGFWLVTGVVLGIGAIITYYFRRIGWPLGPRRSTARAVGSGCVVTGARVGARARLLAGGHEHLDVLGRGLELGHRAPGALTRLEDESLLTGMEVDRQREVEGVAFDPRDAVHILPVVAGVDLDEVADHGASVPPLRRVEERQEHPLASMGVEVVWCRARPAARTPCGTGPRRRVGTGRGPGCGPSGHAR